MGHEVSADDSQARDQSGRFQCEVCLQLGCKNGMAWEVTVALKVLTSCYLLQARPLCFETMPLCKSRGCPPRQDIGWAFSCVCVKALGDTSSTSWWLPGEEMVLESS